MQPSSSALVALIPPLALIALACAACSPQVRGPSHDAPPPPAIGAPIDRVGRPLTANALIAPLGPDDVDDRRKEQYDRAGRSDWAQFAADLEPTLALYDGFDHRCGNQWLAAAGPTPGRYRRLAQLLADDRLWIDSRAPACREMFSVERAALATPPSAGNDCGGRTLADDSVDVFRSLLVLGATEGVDDGIGCDDHVHSMTEFPFVAAP